MIAISHKVRQYLLAAIKVFILLVTFGYVFYKLKYSQTLNYSEFLDIIQTKWKSSGYLFGIFILMAAANWYFEILKWKTVVSTEEKITFLTALKQSLSSLTVSLATPNRIGDYGAKALYFQPSQRKKIMLLNFYSNSVQMFVTSILGLVGLVYLLQNFEINISLLNLAIFLGCLVLIGSLAYYFKEKEFLIKGFSIQKIVAFLKALPLNLKLTVVIYSIIRYAIFSMLFFGLLIFFGAPIGLLQAMPLIFAMYLTVSIIPTLFIFDVVVRGGVAVWLFSMVGVPELSVLSTVFSMWVLNFAIPAFLGSFYVLTYQSATQ